LCQFQKTVYNILTGGILHSAVSITAWVPIFIEFAVNRWEKKDPFIFYPREPFREERIAAKPRR